MTSSESFEDRTEAPTPRRIREARRKGQVVLSRDLAAALSLLAMAGACHMLGPWLLAGMRTGLGRSLAGLHEMDATNASTAVLGAGAALMTPAAPLIAVALIAGLGASLAQVGFLFTGETLRLRPERLNPVEGLQRAFSMRTFVGAAGGLAKGAVIVGILAASLWQERLAFAQLSTRDLPDAVGVLAGAGSVMFAKTALALVALGLVDWGYRRWQHLRDLRMSRRELQDELREFEGDPATRERRRAHYARLDEARRIGRVPGADVVITAGDLAIVLRLEAEPVVVAVGEGSAADRIREAALGHGVAILEKADLARALHKRGASGQPVPAGLREGAMEAIGIAREMKSR